MSVAGNPVCGVFGMAIGHFVNFGGWRYDEISSRGTDL